MATPRRQQRPSAQTSLLNPIIQSLLQNPIAEIVKDAIRKKPAPGYSFSEPRQMAPGYGVNPVAPTVPRPNTDIVPKEPLPQQEPLPQLVRGKDGKMVPYVPSEGTGATQEERIQAEMDRPYMDQAQTEEELFGEATTPSTLRDEIKRQNEKLKEQTAQSQRQADAQTLSINEQARQGEQGISNAQDQVNAIDVGRNGPVSRSNMVTKKGFTTEMRKRLDYLTAQKDEQLAQVEDFMAKAREAEAAGRSDLAAQFRTQAIQAENTITQIDTDYLNSLSQQAQENRAQLSAFQSLVDGGQELSVETIAGFADKLGIPFNDAYGYYQGQQAIRDDKSLDQATKEIELQNLAYDFDRKLRGIETEDQIAIDFLKTMREKGFSEEEISAYKQMNGITDYDDPLTRAELEYQQFENEIKRRQLAGEPTSIAEMEMLFDLRQKMNAEAGTGGAAYVSPSIDGIAMSYEGGGLNVTLPRNADGTLKAYQCGEFVNRAWGISKGGPGGFGDTIGDKMGIVDSNGFRKGSMSPVQLASMIVPGMAFVSEAGETGHVGLIVSDVDAQGNFQTLEANVGDNNPYNPDPPIYKTRNIKDQDLKGFAYPPNGEQVGGEGDAPIISTLDEKTIDNVRSEANSFRQEQIVKDYNVILNKQLSIQSILDSGVGGPGDLAIVYEFMKALDPGSVVRETEYATAAKSGNIFSGAFAKYNGYLKEEGGFLPDTVKESFKELIDLKFQSSQSQYDNLYKQYSQRINNLAGGQNVAPEVLTDYSAGFQSQSGKQLDPIQILKDAKKEAYLESLIPDEDLAEFDSYFN